MKNLKIPFAIKEKNVMKLIKVTFQRFSKITETARWEPPRKAAYYISIAVHSVSKASYCNRRTGYCPYWASCPGGEQFLWFLKHDLLRFYLILFFFDSSKHNFFFMCLVRSIFTNLCPIMIHLNALDFNVCRFEEVISFFWRLVYLFCCNSHILPHLFVTWAWYG